MKRTIFLLLTIVLSRLAVVGADSQELQIVLKEAKDLAKEGDYAAALDKHVWYHEHSRGTAHAGVRLSFAMSDWKRLGEEFPAAKEKLLSIRNEQEKSLLGGKGGYVEFSEVAAIDRTYGNDKRTYELIRKLAEQSPELAGKCFFAARGVIAKNKDYALFLKLGPEPERQFRSRQSEWEGNVVREGNPAAAAAMRELCLQNFRQLIEVLVGTGQLDKAADIQKRAVELTKDKSLETALEDAMRRVKEKP